MSDKDLQKAVMGLIDSELKFWKGLIDKEREGILLMSHEDEYRRALVAVRRIKGKLQKEVFKSQRSK